MFDNDARYATARVKEALDTGTQNLLWLMIDGMEIEAKEDLQVFTLSVSNDGQQKIVHMQTTSNYRKEFAFPCTSPATEKIYVIYDGTTSTMMLSSEYLREESK